MIKQTFTLNDIAQITGIQTNRLRIWKKRYGILEPLRTEGKEHQFDASTLRYMMKVAKMLDQGYRISTVLEMDAGELDDRLESLIQQHDEAYLKQLYDDALNQILDLEAAKLRKIYHKALERFGFRLTLKDLFLPLLSTLGTLWEIGTVHSVHEHLLSNFIRRKLMVTIDLADSNDQKPETTLFLPDQELHDISILMLQYLLLEEDENPVFLGASVPYPDLEDYLEKRHPKSAAGYLTYTGNMDFHVQMLPEVVHKFPDISFDFALPSGYADAFKEGLDASIPDNLVIHEGYEAMNQAMLGRHKQER